MDGVDVIGVGRIAVGDGDDVVVFDRIGEPQFNGGTGRANSGDGIVAAACYDGEGGGFSCCC